MMRKLLHATLITLAFTCITKMLYAQDADFCTKIKSVYNNLTAANIEEIYTDYFTNTPGWQEATKYTPGGMFGNYYTYMLSYNTEKEKDAEKTYKKLVALFNKCLDARHNFDGEGSDRHDEYKFSKGLVSLTQTSSRDGYGIQIMIQRLSDSPEPSE